MYENITKYIEIFGNDAADDGKLQADLAAFTDAFQQAGLMDPDGLNVMGARGWATRSALLEAAPSMTVQEACACISAFLQQEMFIPGLLADQVKQGILPAILQRLQALEG